MKTWFYTLARHAASRLRRSPQRQLAALSEVTDVAERVRSRTSPHLRTADLLFVICDVKHSPSAVINVDEEVNSESRGIENLDRDE
jgi:DNA-directed RNA polymerase specialized sigma24 family protein